MFIKNLKYLSIALLSILSACAKLPEYAKPKFHLPAQEVSIDEKSFGYRKLKIADFHATSLPEDLSGYNHNIQARSCISIRPTSDTSMRITNGMMSGKTVFMGSYSHMAFQAVFNPSCSWWNPEVPKDKVNYVLQHEQIHFALTELSARNMNKLYREGIKGYLAIGSSFQEVQKELLEMMKSVSHKGLEENITQHTAFDEETSLYYEQEVQQNWYDNVLNSLADPAQQ